VRFAPVLLVAANLIPLFGVLFLGWDLFLVLALFWLENVVIGAFAILRILMSRGSGLRDRLFTPIFFIAHYGGFMFGHAILLIAVFGPAASGAPIETFGDFIRYLLRPGIGVALLALIVSHGWSFMADVASGQDREMQSARDIMTAPYRRVVITHVGLIVGALLVERIGQPVLGLVALVVVKILIDLRMQDREAGGGSNAPATGTGNLRH
jgi:hypothetical protein